MVLAALVLLIQLSAFQQQMADEVARNEILDYRGRVEHCSDYANGGPPDWHCNQLAADERRLRHQFSSRPDILKLMDMDSSKFEKDILIRSYEAWEPLLSTEVRHVTHDREGRAYVISANVKNDALQRVTLQLPSRGEKLVIVLREHIAHPDLQTLRARTFRGRMTIELNYGSERPWCFRSSTGQPELTLYLPTPDRVEVTIQSYEGCRANRRKISATLDSKRPQSR